MGPGDRLANLRCEEQSYIEHVNCAVFGGIYVDCPGISTGMDVGCPIFFPLSSKSSTAGCSLPANGIREEQMRCENSIFSEKRISVLSTLPGTGSDAERLRG